LFLVGLGCLIFCAQPAGAQAENLWEQYVRASKEAYRQGDYDGCEKLLHSALDEAEKGGAEDPRVGMTLHNLAQLAATRGRYAEAEGLYRRALAILENTQGPEHVRVGVTVLGLADLHTLQGKNDEAEAFYQRALTILEKAVGRRHAIVATVLERYASLLRKTDRQGEAEKLEVRAREIRERPTAK
jgi:tetratricopeptide (TPR) repeat protein